MIPVQHKKKAPKKRKMKASTLLYKILEDMLAGSRQLCMLAIIALSSGTYERESTAKHGTARHSATQHGTAQQGATPHGTARSYGDAPRC